MAMVRPLRIEYPGAVYHITSRGNKKDPIFLYKRDRLIFLSILKEVCQRYNWLCYAYCLMDNHYHLVIETVDGVLSLGMRLLNGKYTQRFNYIHQRIGHLFQGRYKAILVQKDTYLLELIRYVVLNPVRASVVTSPEKWEWSSYPATMGIGIKPSFLKDELVLGMFNTNLTLARSRFKNFVTGDKKQSDAMPIKGSVFLGDDNFIKEAMKHSKGRRRFKEIAKVDRFIDRPGLEDIFFDVKSKAERNKSIYSAHVKFGYQITEIARHLNLHLSTVSRIFKRFR